VREVVLLGATGSIGTQALDVVARNPAAFRVVGLAAGGTRPELLAAQALDTDAPIVAVSGRQAGETFGAAWRDEASRRGLRPADTAIPKVLAGPDAAAELAGWPCDVVLNGIDGAAGLRPTLAALDAGRTLALANKESLIVGGPLVKERASEGQIVPVDSEHSALAQCLRAGRREEVRRIVLTASGGPFRGRTRAELADVTPEQALAHPTWDMGPLVTVNSATLVNKGLETIEAHLLFDVPFEQIDVVVHPQSIVHSMVTFADGATIAQASPPDMRLPIALGLSWPDRVPDAAPGMDWRTPQAWEFAPLDHEAFPAVGLARECGAAGGVLPAVYNAANETAVAAFLDRRLRFPAIVDTIAAVVAETRAGDAVPAASFNLDDVLGADAWARECAASVVAGTGRPR
jgi:1-deoxy-D-xylulose-5-phosphate reductoisomerase